MKKSKRSPKNIHKHNWEGIHFPSEKVDLKKFEKNNVTVILTDWYAEKEKN